MADTTTPNLGVLLADPNDVFNFPAHTESGFTIIDTYMGAVKCTSGTRPTTTYGGQLIYETDTGRLAENTGTKASPVWTYVSSNVLVYTSSTRPTVNLIAGMLIYESDTDALVRRTGSAWEYATTVTCTSSTRPTTAIVAGTQIYETDTTRFLVYTGGAWQQIAYGTFVCTSSTHPASPFTGLEIFETDTKASAIYTGSAYAYNMATIGETTLGSPAATISFASIPQVYANLLVVTSIKSASTATSSTADNLYAQFNGITSANYNTTSIFNQNTTTALAGFASAQTKAILGQTWTSFSGSTAGTGKSLYLIPNYADSHFAKTILGLMYGSDGGTVSLLHLCGATLNASASTAAITSLTFGLTTASNMVANSFIGLYGMP